jgi:hypothetical protein
MDVTMSTGVVFRITQPSTWAITDVGRQMATEEPEVPMVYITDRDRSEPNASDPAYRKAYSAHLLRLIERQYEVMIATGTEVVSVPDGFPGVDDDWRSRLLGVGVRLSDRPERRYVEWVKYVAAPLNEDWQALIAPLYRQVGTPEEDVAVAVAAFRSVPERGADPEPAGAGSDSDRH